MVRFVFLKPNFEMTLKNNLSQETTMHIRQVISIDKVVKFKSRREPAFIVGNGLDKSTDHMVWGLNGITPCPDQGSSPHPTG